MTIFPLSEAQAEAQAEQTGFIPTPPNLLDRFTVVASGASPEPASQGIRTQAVEEEWTPFLGPAAMMLARKADTQLSNLKDGAQSVAVIVTRWAEALGVFPEEILAAKNRLLRYGLATWEEKGHILSLHRSWPPVPAAIRTPEHRAVLLSIPDLRFDQSPTITELDDAEADRG